MYQNCTQIWRLLACVASVSLRVRRESWDESKKRNDRGGGGDFFFCSRSYFRAITRLETLATQARRLHTKSTMVREMFRQITQKLWAT